MDISETCNLCNKIDDQMLMLKCVHDPCINCAASTYAEQIHIKGQSTQAYSCEICGEQTLLDASTIQELTKLASKFVKTPSPTSRGKASQAPRGYSQGVQQGSRNKLDRKDAELTHGGQGKRVVHYCKEHSEEEVTYYCFECKENICPECAIHGKHKDHSVKMIKHTIPQVKGEYMEKVSEVSAFQSSLIKGKESFLRVIKAANERAVREKHLIGKEFEAMHGELAAREKELLRELDRISKRNIELLTALLEQVNAGYEEANKLKRTVEAVLRKDEVVILQDYKHIGGLTDQIRDLERQTHAISAEVSSLNGDYIMQQLRELAESTRRVQLKLNSETLGMAEYMAEHPSAHHPVANGVDRR